MSEVSESSKTTSPSSLPWEQEPGQAGLGRAGARQEASSAWALLGTPGLDF